MLNKSHRQTTQDKSSSRISRATPSSLSESDVWESSIGTEYNGEEVGALSSSFILFPLLTSSVWKIIIWNKHLKNNVFKLDMSIWRTYSIFQLHNTDCLKIPPSPLLTCLWIEEVTSLWGMFIWSTEEFFVYKHFCPIPLKKWGRPSFEGKLSKRLHRNP